jgi:type II secretory pathway predicted ATPase ExeA
MNSANGKSKTVRPPWRSESTDLNTRVKPVRSSGFAQDIFLGWHGICENPFAGTPDPKYLYESPTHAEAKSSLIVGLECGVGFQALIAPPGMGKTTILFDVIQKFSDVGRTAFLFQPRGDYRDVLRYLLSELGKDAGHDLQDIQESLNQLLLREHAQGRRTIVVVDEAQSLDTQTLETLRLLSNFETPSKKLLQIVLAGQPQLAKNLAAPVLRQLHQRISILKTLVPLDLFETENYIRHRLYVADYCGEPLFTSAAIRLIWRTSHGIPREVNTLCFNALLLSAALRKKQIDESTLDEVIADRCLMNVSGDIATNGPNWEGSASRAYSIPREIGSDEPARENDEPPHLSTSDLQFYNLKLNPFDPVPDPSFLCLTSSHWHALAGLYATIMKRQGPLLLTGAPGSGKSLVVSCVMKLLRSNNNVKVEYVAARNSISSHLKRFGDWEKDRAPESVIFIDEVDNLDPRGWLELQTFFSKVPEQRRTVVLVGRQQIENVLAAPELHALNQSTLLRFRLDHLRDGEIENYISCRVAFVQTDSETAPVFKQDAISALRSHSHGNPAVLNCLCEAALVKSRLHGARTISGTLVEEVAREPHPPATSHERIPRHHPSCGAELLKAAGVLLDLHLALYA